MVCGIQGIWTASSIYFMTKQDSSVCKGSGHFLYSKSAFCDAIGIWIFMKKVKHNCAEAKVLSYIDAEFQLC